MSLSKVGEPSYGAHVEGMDKGVTSTSTEHTYSPTEVLNLWKSLDRQSDDTKSDRSSTTDEAFDQGTQQSLTHEATMEKAMDQLLQDDNNYLLFLEPSMDLNLTFLHPPPGQIFKLWQIYLDNVNPLLKVTHTPTLQASIIDAIGDIANIEPNLEALMFGVYCVAVLSCTEADCLTTFRVARNEMLAQYQIACRQALLRCRFLHSQSRDCLIAFYLYLNSVKPLVDRRSLCSMLGTAVRIAQSMGIHMESANTRCPPFEAEMRRRLWWSLCLFDARVCEGSNNLIVSSLTPTWDCNTPSNLSDFEIRPEMRYFPENQEYPTEAIYVVMRTAISDHIRHSDFHLDFVNPALKVVTRGKRNDLSPESTDGLTILEEMIHTKYLDGCDADDPLHFTASCIGRSQLAKARLVRNYWTASKRLKTQTDDQRDESMSLALEIIECESNLFSSPLSKNFRWHLSHFQFLAYAHVIQDLIRRPAQSHADRAWNIMSHDFESRFRETSLDGHPIFILFANSLVRAWNADERAVTGLNSGNTEPWIVHEMKRISLSSELHTLGEPRLLLADGTTTVDLDIFLPILPEIHSQSQDLIDTEA